MMIYVHIPFCRQKCIYCAFYSVPCRNPQPVEEYVDALCSEIALRKNDLPDEKAETLYFGGGTPSLLSPEMIGKISRALAENFDMSQLQEFTFEANPEQLTKDYLHQIKALGVNRLSIGVQSFSDTDLKFLNRRHTAQQAVQALKTAQDSGFDNISIDLIYGIPQSDSWQSNLAIVETLDVQHLSCYALTMEPGTAYARLVEKDKIQPCDEETVISQYNTLIQWAKQNGFEQYEVSNFCKSGYHSRHNSGYWDGTRYMGFGAAAHSFSGTQRRWNVADVATYIKGVKDGTPFSESEELTAADLYNEYVMTALRTAKGVEKSVLERRFPTFAQHFAEKVRQFVQRGLLTDDGTAFRPTPQGLLMADAMAAESFV
ncbi:MAG: radical SAM family heme chaperone HemW [Bacteroidales bacterium]|nr:radical SAM family heme chaperone HemW [Bacteroidales bacterium]MBP5757967.1 radical SAM family heme chaperone HemW [Bacteroidales bacterium]